jgi:hypothetical protein
MGWSRLVIRVGVAWVLSLVVSAIGLELAHRVVLATGDTTASSSPVERSASAISFGGRQ